MRRPEAVLFDLDGTLYDERRLRRAMVPRLLIGAALGGGPRLLRSIQAYRRTREGLRGESFPTGAALEALHLERLPHLLAFLSCCFLFLPTFLLAPPGGAAGAC